MGRVKELLLLPDDDLKQILNEIQSIDDENDESSNSDMGSE